MDWFPYFSSRFIGKTLDLTFEEVSAYAWILVIYYEHGGPLPMEKVDTLLRLKRKTQRSLCNAILHRFFRPVDNFWVNDKWDQVIEQQKKRSEKARLSAEVRWKLSTANAMRTHMPTQCYKDKDKNINAVLTSTKPVDNFPNPAQKMGEQVKPIKPNPGETWEQFELRKRQKS